MMNTKKISLHVLFIGLMATLIVALPGCKDDKDGGEEKSLAEKIVGKWIVVDSYEKQGDKWVSLFGADDEGWYVFKTGGSVTAYQRSGDKEKTAEMTWSVDETTGMFILSQDDWQSEPLKVVFESDDEFSFYYTDYSDASTVQPRKGEFKDVHRRVGK